MSGLLIGQSIDPEQLHSEAKEETTLNVHRRWIKAEAFIAIWDIAQLIAEGVSFEKKKPNRIGVRPGMRKILCGDGHRMRANSRDVSCFLRKSKIHAAMGLRGPLIDCLHS